MKSAYAVLGYQCWTFYCGDKTIRGSTSNKLGEVLLADIFPATLNDFVKMDWSGAAKQT